MKYKVGDRVRIVKKWNEDTCESIFGGMDKWLGKVMTIRSVNSYYYHMVEDKGECIGDGWVWNEHCIEGLAKDSRKIVVTTDGRETLARLYDGSKVVKSATAKCSPSDEYDFNTGAKIAVERLLGEEKPRRKSKFEVGKYYKADGRIKGIIKITKIDEGSEEWSGVLIDRMHYEAIEGMENDKGGKSFIDGSGFAMFLTPVEYTEKPKLYNGKVVCTKSEYRHWTVGKVYEVKDGVITDDDGDTRGFAKPFKSFEDFQKRLVNQSYFCADFIPLAD